MDEYTTGTLENKSLRQLLAIVGIVLCNAANSGQVDKAKFEKLAEIIDKRLSRPYRGWKA